MLESSERALCSSDMLTYSMGLELRLCLRKQYSADIRLTFLVHWIASNIEGMSKYQMLNVRWALTLINQFTTKSSYSYRANKGTARFP